MTGEQMERWLLKMRVGRRLGVSSAVLVFLMLILAGYGLISAMSSSSTVDSSSNSFNKFYVVETLNQIGTQVALAENSVAFDYNSGQPHSGDLQSFGQAVVQFRSELATFEKFTLSAKESKLLKSASSAFDTYVSMSNQINTAFAGNSPKSIATANNIVSQLAFGSYSTPLSEIYTIQHSNYLSSVKSQKSALKASELIFAILGLATVAIAAVLSRLISRSITRPLGDAVAAIERASSGDLTSYEVEESQDEIGQVHFALAQLISRVGGAISQISAHAVALSKSSEELAGTSADQSRRASDNMNQSNGVAAAAEQVSSNVDQVAASAEEMRAAIDEIARGASEAARVAANAVSASQVAVSSISKLGDSSSKVGEVVSVITSIAEQTNLLALNAAIEAARAGEAGKGFAVVASEVKDLAKETGTATQSIADRIREMQEDTHLAISAIEEISNVINRINDLQSSIASAVEEQSATTQEIGRAVAEAAAGTGNIAEQIVSVVDNARTNSSGADNVNDAARNLAQLSEELKAIAGKFTVGNSSKAFGNSSSLRATAASVNNAHRRFGHRGNADADVSSGVPVKAN
ncbi:MAG: methyl-accepting chemotaxis protein [Actinomycetota bacterium]|nr:methyl-accepting chemotaxis protein [Actinomycetota bacterium]